jgi:protoheme IX farnesyltransferase
MARTRLRPVPSGRIAPPVALGFGIGLAAIAFWLFWQLVNPLSAFLASGGLLWYVWIYTIWLKRSSPQNIVIGGAAGAFRALVGWAAVAGRLDLIAFYLFKREWLRRRRLCSRDLPIHLQPDGYLRLPL